MSGAQFGSFILALVVVAIVVAIGVWLLHWLYLRSSKERSFVRTGLGGQKVVLDGGAFVLPIVHDVIPVNMNTLQLEVSRGRDKALITKDRMRVDVIAEFYVRVATNEDAVAAAAQTLGLRTMEPEQLKERLRRRGPDATDRTDRAPQEAAQRCRAGHAHRHPQQEPRSREALARHRPRKRTRAPGAAARAGDGAGPPACRGVD